jgi:hypothetical protein
MTTWFGSSAKASKALNEKYQSDRPNIFYLFHRSREWNEQERVWMGYERKRGKLSELNRCLRGGSPEGFSRIAGDLSLLPHIQYVITLDTDTELPRDAARQLAERWLIRSISPCMMRNADWWWMGTASCNRAWR